MNVSFWGQMAKVYGHSRIKYIRNGTWAQRHTVPDVWCWVL